MKTRRLLYQDKLVFLVSFFLSMHSKGQSIANYVSNGGFESHYTCTASIISVAKSWRSIDSVTGIALYYNACTPTSPVPWDGVSYQYPRHGNGFGGTTFLCEPPHCSPDPNRGYFRNRLKSNLINGKTYCVKFYANIRDNSTYGIDGIAAFFADNSIDTITKPNIPLTYINPQVQNPVGNIITDTMNWTLITGTFTANGAEKHLVIGNFKSDTNTGKTLINPSNLPTIGCDVYIDDVSCIPIDLPAYAGPDMPFIPGSTVYIGRPQDVGIDEACTWYNITNTTTPVGVAAGITVTPALTSTYIVKQDICGNIKWDTVIVYQSMVGLAEINALNTSLKVYPSPANDLLYLHFNIGDFYKEFIKAEVINSIGEIVRFVDLEYDQGQGLIDVRSLSPGVYSLNVKNRTNFCINKRFLIAH